MQGAKLPLIIDDRPSDFVLGSAPLELPRGGAFRDYEQPGTVTFFLTAPEKTAAHVVGDFNGWDPQATPMETDGRGFFWATVPLRGTTHYRFVVAQDDAGSSGTEGVLGR
jgi:1,4-alpha-glucan branching enzyme